MEPGGKQLKTSGSLLEHSIRKPFAIFIEKLKRSNKMLVYIKSLVTITVLN